METNIEKNKTIIKAIISFITFVMNKNFILVGFGVLLCNSCTQNKTINETSVDRTNIIESKKEDYNDTLTQDSSIIYPPVPDGCQFVGRWHIKNINEESFNVYILMFDCDGTSYITMNGVTIKLIKKGDRLYETYRGDIKTDYYILVDNLIHLCNDEYGDFTDEFGYVVKPY